MKRILTAMLAAALVFGAYMVCGYAVYTVQSGGSSGNGIFSEVRNIFRSDSIEGDWTLAGYYDCGLFYGAESSRDIYGGSLYKELSFNEDGTYTGRILEEDREWELSEWEPGTGIDEGSWEEVSDGSYVLYGDIGRRASVEDGKLYIGGTYSGLRYVFER